MQALPQAPQLVVLVLVLTQVSVHSVGLAVGHLQELFSQRVCGAAHTLPQPPQLLALLVVLTQLVPHNVGVAEGQVQLLF